MPEYWVDPSNGNDANNGLSPATPWLRIPGQAGANAVAAGDIINVRNGTVSYLPISVPASNLTYRGYGLAPNKLVLTQPHHLDPSRTYDITVVREPGVHEGMWVLDVSATSLTGIYIDNPRTNVTIEDVSIIGAEVAASSALVLGSNAYTGGSANHVVRRCEVQSSSASGFAAFAAGVTVEFCAVRRCVNNCVTLLVATDDTTRRAGTDIVRYCDLRNPNMNRAGEDVGTFGVNLNTGHIQGVNNSRLIMHSIYFRKDTLAARTGWLHDFNGGLVMSRIHITGRGPCGFAHGTIGGDWIIRRVYADMFGRDASGISHPLFNYGAASGTTQTQAIKTGRRMLMTGVVVNGNMSFLWSANNPSNGLAWDGEIIIANCTALARRPRGLSHDGLISMTVGTDTLGTNFRFRAINNVLDGGGQMPVVRFEDASSRFEYTANISPPGSQYFIDPTAYTSIGAFESALTAGGATARLNIQEPPQLDGAFRPKMDSVCIGNAILLDHPVTAFDGMPIKAAPDIGAAQNRQTFTRSQGREWWWWV